MGWMKSTLTIDLLCKKEKIGMYRRSLSRYVGILPNSNEDVLPADHTIYSNKIQYSVSNVFCPKNTSKEKLH